MDESRVSSQLPKECVLIEIPQRKQKETTPKEQTWSFIVYK